MIRILCLFLILVSTSAWSQQPFITYWKTDNPGASEDNQITLPIVVGSPNYDFVVQWGDGTVRHWKSGDPLSWLTHTYPAPGNYAVTIYGNFPMIYHLYGRDLPDGLSRDPRKLLRVMQWGDTSWSNMRAAFSGVQNLEITASDAPDLSNVSNMYAMFAGASSMNSNLNHWDVSNVTNMSSMFQSASQFNGDISSWDVRNVTAMPWMFWDATAFNRDISAWNVGKVTDMTGMFLGASSFNANIANWNVGNVTNMSRMFANAQAFNRNLSAWDVRKVTTMERMFENIGSNFNPNVAGWNVSNVTNMERMFYNDTGASAFNRNLGNWNIGKVETMKEMLDFTALSVENYDATLQGWAAQSPNLQDDVEVGVQGLKYCQATTARQFLIDVHGWSFVGDQRASDCPGPFVTLWKTDNPGPSTNNQITIPIHPDEHYDFHIHWGDGNSTSWKSGDHPSLLTHTYSQPGTYLVHISGTFPRIYFNFSGDRQKILAVMDWGDIEWSSMEHAFAGAVNLNVFHASGTPDLSQVDSTRGMFDTASSLTANLNHWDVSNVKVMADMFKDAHAFNGTIGAWNVSNVVDMSGMFRQAFSFNADIRLWNTGNAETMRGMFRGAEIFNQDIGYWNVGKVNDMREMFLGATAFNRNLGNWNIREVVDMSEMLRGSGLSTASYDATLTGWASGGSAPSLIPLGAEGLVYCDAADARQALIDTKWWEISGDNFCNPVDLDPPVLLSPDNLSDSESIPVTLTWQAVDSAGQYQVQVTGAMSWFDFPVLDTMISQTSISVSQLQPEEWYIWRVRARSEAGQYGDWSEIWYFNSGQADDNEQADIIFRDRMELRAEP
jgi:surface protein